MGSKVKALAEERWRDIDGGAAFILPLTALRHENFKRLKPHAIKLLLDLARQYTGYNNGYLCPSWTLMQHEGWVSRDTLFHAVRELEHYGWIQLSRQGGRNRANLYALTFRRVDEKLKEPDNALDLRPTLKPSDAWKKPATKFEKEPRKPHKLFRSHNHAQRVTVTRSTC